MDGLDGNDGFVGPIASKPAVAGALVLQTNSGVLTAPNDTANFTIRQAFGCAAITPQRRGVVCIEFTGTIEDTSSLSAEGRISPIRFHTGTGVVCHSNRPIDRNPSRRNPDLHSSERAAGRCRRGDSLRAQSSGSARGGNGLLGSIWRRRRSRPRTSISSEQLRFRFLSCHSSGRRLKNGVQQTASLWSGGANKHSDHEHCEPADIDRRRRPGERADKHLFRRAPHQRCEQDQCRAYVLAVSRCDGRKCGGLRSYWLWQVGPGVRFL